MTKSVKISDIQKLAIPALISGIAEPILSITDTIIVGNIPENATISLGAVGIVGSFISMLIWVFGQTRSVIASIIAQALGQKNLKAVETLPAQGILIIISSSFLIILLTFFNSENLFKFYNASGDLLQFSVDYFNIRVWGLPFTLLTIGIFGILTRPSVKALKYRPVPPTRIGIFFLFLISKIFFFVNFSQSPEEKFFFALINPYK